jgi:hypothetical protein
VQQEMLVLKKDGEAEKRFGELRVKTLEDAVTHQQAQIAGFAQRAVKAEMRKGTSETGPKN